MVALRLRFGLLLWLSLFAGCVASGRYHTVQPGESLERIAKAYGRSEAQIARINGLTGAQPLSGGERLFIPGATASKRIAPAPTRHEHVAAPPSPVPASKRLLIPAPTGAPPVAAPVAAAPRPQLRGAETMAARKVPPKAEKGRFSWPLRGSIARRFGDPLPFPCKGIEIAAPLGTPVQAAAAGRVIYSGDGISSFGNMIILRHDGDFYTVYAFAQQNLVKVGRFVSKGERIAFSGKPPQHGSPRLYFEVRQHQVPLDPTFYLP